MTVASALKVKKVQEQQFIYTLLILMTDKKPGFNQAVEELENILKQIESGELDVDELSGKVKRASELLRLCQSKLRDTEEEIDKIISDME